MSVSRSTPEPGFCDLAPGFSIRNRLYMKANKKRNIILPGIRPATTMDCLAGFSGSCRNVAAGCPGRGVPTEPRLAGTPGLLELSPVYWTVSVAVDEEVMPPLVPVIVSVYVVLDVLDLVVILSVEDPDPVTDVGLKEEVARFGRPLTERFTLPANPAPGISVTV
jgi:hypothetical protein